MPGSDVKTAHLHSSGYVTKHRTRLRALDVVGSAQAGLLDIWDTDTIPVAATYGRSGATVTVTKADHGLKTGDVIGISFEEDSGNIATPGNYEITVVNSSTFTLTDINEGTITNDPDCYYVFSETDGIHAGWLATYHTSASDIFYNGFNFPDEGVLAKKGLYVRAVNMSSLNFYFN